MPYVLNFSPEMALTHSGWLITVSPINMRKVGRPRVNSKNKKRTEDVNLEKLTAKAGPLKVKKRGARKALMMGELSGGWCFRVRCRRIR